MLHKVTSLKKKGERIATLVSNLLFGAAVSLDSSYPQSPIINHKHNILFLKSQ